MPAENPSAKPGEETQSVAERLGADAPSARRARLRVWLLPSVVVAIAAIATVAWLGGGDTTTTEYVTQPVERADLTVTVSATGSLAPTNQVDVGSELSGIVRTVEVDVNDRVEAGQLLAQLDTTRLEAQEMQAQAALEAAEAQVLQRQATLEETTTQLERLERGYERSGGLVASLQELDAQRATVQRARADVASAAANVSQARAALEAIQTDLSKTAIYSPIDGLILTREIEPGQTVAASFQAPVLFTIAGDLAQMQLTVNVDEADVGQVWPGQKAIFTVDAYPNRAFEAEVDVVRFAPETVSGVVTYPTTLYVDNEDLLLRPGMTATSEIVVRQVEDALLVPNAALRFVPPVQETAEDTPRGRGFFSLFPGPPAAPELPSEDEADRRVWVLRDGAAVAVSIRTGASDGARTEVVEGDLEPGMPVIVDVGGL